MTIGVKIWDADAKVLVDYTTHVWNVFGSFYTTGSDGFVDNPLITADTKYIIASSDVQKREESSGYDVDSPVISVANGRISWAIPASGRYYTRWYVLYGG